MYGSTLVEDAWSTLITFVTIMLMNDDIFGQQENDFVTVFMTINALDTLA
jgi:hypothetical protein